MVKQSQKELLDEGFGSLLRKSIGSAARGAAAVGGALKSASDAGVKANVGGIVKGAKAGYEAEKQKQKGPDSELEKILDDMAFIKIGSERQKGDTYIVKVADLEFDDNTGEEKEGQIYDKPLILKWEKDNRAFKVVRNPKGQKAKDEPTAELTTVPEPVAPEPESVPEPETPEPEPEPEPEAPQYTASNFKNSLKQFVMDRKKGEEFMSKLAVTEFVRHLAKSANNATWYKNIPQKIKQVKKDNRNFSNPELSQLIQLLKMDGILQESQKNLLRQLTLLTD